MGICSGSTLKNGIILAIVKFLQFSFTFRIEKNVWECQASQNNFYRAFYNFPEQTLFLLEFRRPVL